MDFTHNNIMYTIPLDAIDMEYILSKARNPGKELLPIWNINEDKSKKFCKFIMFAQHRGETVDEVSYEDANYAPPRDHIHVQTRRQRQRQKRKERTLGKQTPVSSIDKLSTGPVPATSCTRKDAVVTEYYCNVCNVDIPTMYMDQHTSSKIHRLRSKIVDICVKRGQPNLKPTQGWEKKTDSCSYFCNPCCVVVKKIERRKHELTRSHFKSLMQERFLYDLLQILIDKEHLEKVDFEYINNYQFNENNDYNSSDDSDSYSDDGNDDDDDDDDDKDIVVPQTSDLKEKNVETTSPVKNLTSVQNVEPKPERGTNVPKNRMNLKDYIEMINATSMLSNAPLVSVKDDHVKIVTSDKHVLHVPEDNFHGYTRIDQWTTCRLCLKAVNDEEESHKMTKEHIKWLFTPIPNKHGVREIHSFMKHCVLCNDQFYDLEQHIQSVTHKEAIEDSLKRVINMTNIVNQPRNSPKLNKKYCEPCSSYIDKHNYYLHVRGQPHMSNAKLFAGRTKKDAALFTSQTPNKSYK